MSEMDEFNDMLNELKAEEPKLWAQWDAIITEQVNQYESLAAEVDTRFPSPRSGPDLRVVEGLLGQTISTRPHI